MKLIKMTWPTSSRRCSQVYQFVRTLPRTGAEIRELEFSRNLSGEWGFQPTDLAVAVNIFSPHRFGRGYHGECTPFGGPV